MKVAALILTMFLAVVSAAGQVVSFAQNKKAISKEEFAPIQKVAFEFLAKEPHRIKSTHETFANEGLKPEKISISMTEYIPPNREHNFYGLNSEDASRKYERIKIADKIFVTSEGKWRLLDTSGALAGPPSAASSSTEYYFHGIDNVGEKKVKVYEVVSCFRFWSGQAERLSFYSEKYWIDKDGRIIKKIGESDGSTSKRSRTTELFEYDPKIKIEAPMK